MEDPKDEPNSTKSEKLISWILTGVGVGLVGIGIVGYFLQTPEVLTPEAPRAGTPPAAAADAPKDPKTPIVLITVDGLRADALTQGAKVVPNLSAIAKTSHQFKNAIAASNHIGSSAASILTGTFPSTHQFYWMPWYQLPNGKKVDPAKTIYFTAPAQSVALQIPFLESQSWLQNWWISRSPSMTAGFSRNTLLTYQVDPSRTDTATSRTPALVQNFLTTLDTTRPEASFYWFHFDDLTLPYVMQPSDLDGLLPKGAQPTAAQLASYKYQASNFPPKPKGEALAKAIYWGAVRSWDRNLGTLIEGLKKRKLFDAASIVLVGTNGQHLGEDKRWTLGDSIAPAAVRVPLLLKLRGQNGGTTHNAYTSTVNIAPTIRALAGYQTPATTQGKSLLKSIEKAKAVEAVEVPAVSEMYTPTQRSFTIYDADGAAECHDTLDPTSLEKKMQYCFWVDLTADAAGRKYIGWGSMSKLQQKWVIKHEELARRFLDMPKDPFAMVRLAK